MPRTGRIRIRAVGAGCADGGQRSVREAQEAGYAAFARWKAVA
jgi:hypothetical protein